MSFNWSEYLSLAEVLGGVPVSGAPPSAEAQQRAAVSRAYYAAFASARNRLRDSDGIAIPPGGNPHHLVTSEYEKGPEPLRTGIGISLHRLRVDRNRCDYDDIVENLTRTMLRSLTGAAQVLADLARL